MKRMTKKVLLGIVLCVGIICAGIVGYGILVHPSSANTQINSVQDELDRAYYNTTQSAGVAGWSSDGANGFVPNSINSSSNSASINSISSNSASINSISSNSASINSISSNSKSIKSESDSAANRSDLEVNIGGAGVNFGINSGGSAGLSAIESFDTALSNYKEDSYSDEVESNNLEYDKMVDGSIYTSVLENPLSTFGADVDTGSYVRLRAAVNSAMSRGRLDYYTSDTRIEEMVNYFRIRNSNSFNGDGMFDIRAEISKTPWNEDSMLMFVTAKVKDMPESVEKKGNNIVLLIDTSGSMDSSDKMPLVKESCQYLIKSLTEKDLLSIITYSGEFKILANAVNPAAERASLMRLVNSLKASGATDGGTAMKTAYNIANKYKDDYINNRVVMMTDGDFNVGVTSTSGMESIVTENKQRGIYLTILGFGLDSSDDMMETMADKGNGNYYMIDSDFEAKRVMVDDLQSAIVTAADDVKFQVEFNPNVVKGYKRIGYNDRVMSSADFVDDTKDGGEVGYGHEVTVVYEVVPVDSLINIPYAKSNKENVLEIDGLELKYQDIGKTSSDFCTINVRYKDHGESESKLETRAITSSYYTDSPTSRYKFLSNVVAFGLLLNNDYCGDWDVSDVRNNLNDMRSELKTEDQSGFLDLVERYLEK